MYASQTKRLCVREAPSDETRLQHHSSSSSTSGAPTTAILSNTIQQQSTICRQSDPAAVSGNLTMTASASSMTESAIGFAATSTEITPQTFPCHQPAQSDQQQLPLEPTRLSNCLNNDHLFDGTEHKLINKLANAKIEEANSELLVTTRNLITACNKKKDSIVCNPNFTKILGLIADDKPSSTVKTQLALLICSIAKSSEHNIRVLNQSLVDEKILNIILNSEDLTLIEACLRCMRSLMSWPKVSRTGLFYEYQDSNISNENDRAKDSLTRSSLKKMISFARESKSFTVQECIADIFTATCGRNRDQAMLYRASAIPCIVQLLESQSQRVVVASLNWLTRICLKNNLISQEVVKTKCPSGLNVLDKLLCLMAKENCFELQFLSARCYVNIYRALTDDVLKGDRRLTGRVLPTLARLVKPDKQPQLRIKAAECIAYLIECDPSLQDTASVCDRLIDSLANMLEYDYEPFSIDIRDNIKEILLGCKRRSVINTPPRLIAYQTSDFDRSKNNLSNELDYELAIQMKRAAFLALAALASSLETIRKKVFNTCIIMKNLVTALSESDPELLKSVLTCLLSLSRSVQQLRTSFAENSVYNVLKSLLTTSSNDILILVLAILCNVSLDFSPGKQHFLDDSTIETLCKLTHQTDPFLRLHGMWILMNTVYQLKDELLKFKILSSLGVNHILSLLDGESDEEISLKTLGFLRNLLSQRSHIDAIMSRFGDVIVPALMSLLERPGPKRIKEQALCVLTNIADGSESKSFIMDQNILSHLARIICDEQAGDLRLAAICCITNLAHRESEGSFERRDEMKKFGIEDELKSLLNTGDPILSDRVRTAYNQFSIGLDDKYVN